MVDERDEDFVMEMDDDDDEEMYLGDDIYTDSGDSDHFEDLEDFEGDSDEEDVEDIDELSFYVQAINKLRSYANLDNTTLRHLLFDKNLKAVSGSILHEDLMLGASLEDKEYLDLIVSLYPALGRFITQAVNTGNRELLIQSLGWAVSATVWDIIELEATKRKMTPQELLIISEGANIDPAFPLAKISPSEYLRGIVVDADSFGVAYPLIISENLGLLKAVKEGVEEVRESVEHPIKEAVANDEFDELDPEVESATHRVMQVYQDLFEVGFELQEPYGILTKDGVLRLKPDGKTHHRVIPSLSNIYKMVKSLTGNFLVQSEISDSLSTAELRRIRMRKGTTYYPEFQLGNLLGILETGKVDTWDKLSRSIAPEIRRNIQTNLKAGVNISEVVDSLTTCIVISEFDPNNCLKLRINVGNGILKEGTFSSEYVKRKSTIMHGTGELFHVKRLNSGVVEVTLVFNQAAFNGRPLFAYEAVLNLQARGKKPNLQNMILGQDTSGKIMTINLDRQNASIILVGAGQRSGKGVLTLNMLGTILSEGCPLIYLDGKPDMAPVLWNLGNKYGIKPAAWDLFERNGNPIGRGAPERLVRDNPGIFGVLMYLKALQLMMVAASFQSKGIQFGDGKRPFFIFDEVFAAQMAMSASWKEILNTAKSKTSDPEEKAWCTHIVEWAQKLDSNLPAVINSQLPKSGISTVWLFQSIQPTSWNAYQTEGMTSSAKFNILKNAMMSRLSIKLLGKGTADSENGLGHSKVKEDKIIASRVLADGGRHFAMSTSQKITDMSAVTVFKPYLVLNEAHDDAPSVQELKNNVSDDVWNVIAPNGSLNPAAGFEGFAKLLGDQAIQNIRIGVKYLEAVMQQAGILQNYNSVDEYLYDASMESFQTLGTLVSDDVYDDEGNEGASYKTGEGFQDSDYGEPLWETTEELNVSGRESDFKENTDTRGNFSDPSTTVMEERDPLIGRPLPEGYKRTKAVLNKPSTEEEPHVPPSERMGYTNVYQEEIKIPENLLKALGSPERPLAQVANLNFMSGVLMKEIRRVFGDLGNIDSIEVTGTGLVINDIAFRPRFSQDILDNMTFNQRSQVLRGNVIELFDFSNLSKFKNLVVIRIDNPRLAEGRVRREIGLGPKKNWYTLFRKFKYLKELYIGGTQIIDESSAQTYDNNGRGGFTLTESLRKVFGVKPEAVTNSGIERLWDSRPVRIATGAVGWTLGVKAIMMATSFFGPWGLVMGAFAGLGAYKEFKNRRDK